MLWQHPFSDETRCLLNQQSSLSFAPIVPANSFGTMLYGEVFSSALNLSHCNALTERDYVDEMELDDSERIAWWPAT
jgi:hypothetical protein